METKHKTTVACYGPAASCSAHFWLLPPLRPQPKIGIEDFAKVEMRVGQIKPLNASSADNLHLNSADLRRHCAIL